ncbi:MAG: head-tail connector protein [Roseateles sp.]|uniref:head-tail connector protein n=1 Tax=Roseateles sp. TaxID=1971397 RepID=UPI004035DD67
MTIKTITPPSEEPVTVAEMRAQCRIDETAEDDLLSAYITAARLMCEQLTGRVLVTQTVEQPLDAFPADGIKLLAPPAQSITSVKYVDSSGAEQTLAPAGYVFEADSYPGGLVMPADAGWPDTYDKVNAVRVRFVAGYGDAEAVPAALKVWIMVTASTLYANREAVDMTGRVQALPERFIDRLLDAYRVFGS